MAADAEQQPSRAPAPSALRAQPATLVYHVDTMSARPTNLGEIDVPRYRREAFDFAEETMLWRAGLWRLASGRRSLTELLSAWANNTLSCGEGPCQTFEDSILAIENDDSRSSAIRSGRVSSMEVSST